MPVVKLKIDNVERPVEEILTIFQSMTGFDLMYYKKENDIMAVFMTSNQHVDKLMTAEVRAALANEGVEVIKSEEYLANSTIIAKNVPRSLHDKLLEEIANDISECNEAEVVRVDWKGTDTLFIEFNTIEDATRMINSPEGIKLSFERSITDMKKKPFLNIPQCPRCFSFEHESNGCPKTVRTCYHCGEEGHAGERCATSYVRCANCGGDHVAFAFKCPVRKQKESEMKEDGWCPPDTTDGAASRNYEDEEESTKRAEEEVSIIFGLDKLRAEHPEQCDFHQESTDPIERPPTPFVRIRADPTGLSGSPNKSLETSDLCEDTIDSAQPRASVVSKSITAGARARASANISPPPVRAEDPLPVLQGIRYPNDRPPSRLGEPVSSPIVRPVPRSPGRSPVGPSQSGEGKGHH